MDVLNREVHAVTPAAKAKVRPVVSVIVPTRDRPHFLREALESIRALEGPEFDLEIVIGDNGNTPQNITLA